MEKEYAPTSAEKKQAKPTKQAVKQAAQESKPVKKEETKQVPSTEEKPAATENKEIKEVKPVIKQVITKKDFAVAKGDSIRASKKHCMYIGEFIKGKSIDQSIAELEQVVKLKRAIPMKGEIPHRKGKGMMSGRYPVDTAKIFISILKGLKGNVIVNGMDISKTRIFTTMSNWASRPARGGGIRAKRTHVIITARETKETKK